MLRLRSTAFLLPMLVLISRPAAGDSLTPSRALNQHAATDRGDDHHAAVAAGPNGVVISVWTSTDSLGGRIGEDADVLYARSSDNGVTWSVSAPIAAHELNDSAEDRDASVATDGRGRWLIAWASTDASDGSGGDYDLRYVVSVDDGLHWSLPRLLNTDGGIDAFDDRAVRLATDRSGQWMAIWSKGDGGAQDVFCAQSLDSGMTFGPPLPLTDARSSGTIETAPTVASNERGVWVAAWTSRPFIAGPLGVDADILFSRSEDGGASWSPVRALNSNAGADSGDDDAVDLAADGGGAWVAVWHSFEPMPWGPDGDILSARSLNDALTWSTTREVYSFSMIELGHEYAARIATDRLGTWVLVWWREDSLPGTSASDTDILQARSLDRGATWIGPELINDDALIDVGDDRDPSVATTRTGSWIVVWTSDDPLQGTIGTDLDVLFAVAACGDGLRQLNEQCDDGNVLAGDCCSPSCRFEAAQSICRATVGTCDEVEVCDGVSGTCPPDRLRSAGTECRPAAGECNPSDLCTGTDPRCPADVPSPFGEPCRPAQGACDLPEACDGIHDACPPDLVDLPGVECRPSQGVCDPAERCTGASPTCPRDELVARGVTCRAKSGACDRAESCSGTSAACPPDALITRGTTCRAPAGACDAAEACDGVTTQCPADVARPDGAPCSDGTVCDGSEICLSGRCSIGLPLSCDDNNACTAETCVEPGGCSSLPIAGCCLSDADCNDGNACTTDRCSGPGGVCQSAAIPGCCLADADCDDRDACTADACSAPGGQCATSRISGCCAEDSDCGPPRGCASYRCDPLEARCEAQAQPGCCAADVDCDDGNSCTTDRCALETGLCSTSSITDCCATDADCSDGDRCTSDRCDPFSLRCTRELIAGCCAADSDCDDGKLCTVDRCDPKTARCIATPSDACCTADEDCAPSGARCGVARCDVAERACTIQSLSGCCTLDSDCDDRNGCTLDTCEGGQCNWREIPACGPDGGAGEGGADGGVDGIDSGSPDTRPADAEIHDAAGAQGDGGTGSPRPPVDVDDLVVLGLVEDDDGCECRASKTHRDHAPFAALLLAGAAALLRRRRSPRARTAMLVVSATALASPALAEPRPIAGMLELGLAAGTFMPAQDHELYNSLQSSYAELKPFGLDLGARAAYFPLSFFGAEIEGELAPSRTTGDRGVFLFGARGHLVLQVPQRLTPFVLAGGGVLGLGSSPSAVGTDVDPAFHWGGGLKYFATERLSFRVDGRQLISAARGAGEGNTSHLSVMVGISFALWRADEAPLVREAPAPHRLVPLPEPDRDLTPPIPASVRRVISPEPSAPQRATQAALERLHFKWGSAIIRPQDVEHLDAAAEVMRQHTNLRVTILGHADSTGGERFNLGLSLRRAQTVKEALISRGVTADRLEARGLGESVPVASNGTRDGRARNRRIEFDVFEVEAIPGVPIPFPGPRIDHALVDGRGAHQD